MRIPMRAISLLPAVLALVLFCGISIPAFASGDDKPADPAASKPAARPDREKKVYTNDDIDRMWPKQSASTDISRASQSQNRAAANSRTAASLVSAPLPAEKDPLWYAQQLAALSAELDQTAAKEQTLREFRANGSAPGARIGLQLNAPCEGYTTDNAIAQLAFRREEIQQQIAALDLTAHDNGVPPGVLRDAPAILAAAQKPPSPAEQQAALEERQLLLADQLADTQDELSGMSAEAAAARATLQQPTPGFGGNMTTDLIERLDNRVADIQSALVATEDAARAANAQP